MKQYKTLLSLVVCIALPLLTGSLAGLATNAGVRSWYPALNKPYFTPPDALFGPVWTCLYLLMGISLFLVWQERESPYRKKALSIFGIQLLLNVAWSFIFFSLRQIGPALVEIILLWCCILFMIVLFHRINKKAAYLQVPYLLWVSFATVLNAALWKLNA